MQHAEKGLGKVVLEDLRRGGAYGHFRRDLQDLHGFYLTDERREQLASMGWLRRTFLFWAWLFKGLMMKLAPPRRLALLAGLALVLMGGLNWQVGEVRLTVDLRIIGTALVLAVLMLELKDKLLARDEIEVARQVQLALLPASHPRLEGWTIWSHTRPANDVGGDLVDYLDLDGGRLGVALGDVAGKGLGAALLMAKLQATLRATASQTDSLALLGDRLNAILLRNGLANRYATLFYFEISPGSGCIRCLNAGHNPPLALRAGGIEVMKAASPPVGMLAQARFVEHDLETAPGDLLIVYSDGLTEARNEREEEFGLGRLEDLARNLRGLTAEAAGTRLLREIDAFLGDARLYDDLSLVVVARSDG